ncbi:GNAT family N-acetyltransferase [Actinomycetaceae bacterium MB13-C1-2]|nr:GNAT family N-acetyltransferase [Actinomycetaceae bacterium MB13-C1-2]
MESKITCSIADTDSKRLEQMSVRWDVFVVEQEVAPVLEIDARDFAGTTTELIASDDSKGRVVGAARLLRDGEIAPGEVANFHIGRVAVRKEARGQGIGERLMRFAEEVARSQVPFGGFLLLTLDAQVQAEGFYRRLGYEPTKRRQFYDAGILHQEMVKTTTGTDSGSVGEGR